MNQLEFLASGSDSRKDAGAVSKPAAPRRASPFVAWLAVIAREQPVGAAAVAGVLGSGAAGSVLGFAAGAAAALLLREWLVTSDRL